MSRPLSGDASRRASKVLALEEEIDHLKKEVHTERWTLSECLQELKK